MVTTRVPCRPRSSPVPESGTTPMVSCCAPALIEPELQHEASVAPVQRAGHPLDGDVAGRALGRRHRRQHFALADGDKSPSNCLSSEIRPTELPSASSAAETGFTETSNVPAACALTNDSLVSS